MGYLLPVRCEDNIFFFRHDLCDEAITIGNRLNEHDLFMDLYHYASACGNSSIASIAWRKAERILTEETMADTSSCNFYFEIISDTDSSITFITSALISGPENCDSSCSSCSCDSERHNNCSPETNNSGKLPSPIVVSSSNRASFAAITRVNSTNVGHLSSTSARNSARECPLRYSSTLTGTGQDQRQMLGRTCESTMVRHVV